MYLLVKNKDKTITIKEDNINSISSVFDASEADEMVLGGAVPSELKVSIFNEQDQFQDYKFFGSTITLFNDKEKALGTFVCSNPVINEYLINLEANDYLANADVLWNGAVFPLSEWELLLNVCNQLGFVLAINKSDLPCADVVIVSSDGIKGETCRNILRYIAEANGMFCYMDGWGRLDFKSYDFSESKKDIPFSDIDDLQVEEVKTFRDGVRIDNDKIGGGTSSYLEITNNPILTNLSDANIQLSVQEIYKKIKGMDYYATSLKTWDDNNDLWLGDYYTVENIRGEIIPTIIMQINIGDGTIHYQGFGDTFEKKQTDAAEEAGMAIESFDEEVDFGKTNNAMRINAKSGTFTICEKKVDNVSKFTRVFLCASGRFTYTKDKEATFEVYADDIKIKEFSVLSRGTQDFCYCFMADTRQAKTNVYSLKVRVNEGDEIDFIPFDVELAILVKSGEIDDVQATDQLFVEEVSPFKINDLNFRKLRFGTITDILIMGPLKIIGGPWDISQNKDGSIMATMYENGLLDIVGDGVSSMQDIEIGWDGVAENTPWLYEGFGEQITNVSFNNCYDVNGFDNGYDLGESNLPISNNYQNLREITLSNVKNINDCAFRGLPEVSIYFQGDLLEVETLGMEAFSNTKIKNETLTICGISENGLKIFDSFEMAEEYATISNLKYLYLENIQQIGYCACKNNKSLEGIFIKSRNGNMANFIQNYAFQNCTNLFMFTTSSDMERFVIDYKIASDYEFWLGSTIGNEVFANTGISDFYIENIEETITTTNYSSVLKWVVSNYAFVDSNVTLHLCGAKIEENAIDKIKKNFYFANVVDYTIVGEEQ